MEQDVSANSHQEDDHLLRLCLYIAIAPPLMRFCSVHCEIFGELIDKGWLATIAPAARFFGAACFFLGLLSRTLVPSRHETRVRTLLIWITSLAAGGWSTAVLVAWSLPNYSDLRREHQIGVSFFLVLTCLFAGIVCRGWKIRHRNGKSPRTLMALASLLACGWMTGGLEEIKVASLFPGLFIALLAFLVAWRRGTYFRTRDPIGDRIALVLVAGMGVAVLVAGIRTGSVGGKQGG